MQFAVAIDRFIEDMRLEGRINSTATERDYRGTLGKHCDDVKNRDPAKTGREDIKRTLKRWPHPNSQGKNRSILVSFYDWMVEEGMRATNPARQTRRPKRRPTTPYRLTRGEVVALLGAAQPGREQRAIFLGVCAGLRSGELRGLQGRHLARDGYVHVTADIAKGGRERWVPITGELAPLVAQLRGSLAIDDYVLCAHRWRDPGINRRVISKSKRPMSPKALWELVRRVGQRAGIAHPIHPHLLRHAFADHMSRHVPIQDVSALLGHANVSTTQTYVGQPSPDELKAAIAGFAFGALAERVSLSRVRDLVNPVEAPTGIEPV